MSTPKAGTAYTFTISLLDTATPGALKLTPTLATGDFKVSVNGGALANLATLPVETPAGSGLVVVSLAGAEVGTRTAVRWIDPEGEWGPGSWFTDAPTATVEDVAATLATIAGYLDTEIAAILAAVDTEVAAIKAKTDQLTFTVANVLDANVLRLSGSTTAAALLMASALGIYAGTVTGASPTTTTLVDSALGGLATDFFKNAVLLVTSGAQARQRVQVTGYNGGTNTLTFSALTGAMAQNDSYVLL